MKVQFEHKVHPRLSARRPVPSAKDERQGFNARLAVLLTNGVGTMWCAYAFALLALLVLPAAIHGGLLTTVQWLSQTFIQLVMLSVIMVGQNIISRASEERAQETYQDAEAAFHESLQIQKHLAAQDEAINHILSRLEALQPDDGRS